MRIHRLSHRARDGSRLTCGVNAMICNDQPIVNLFDLAENKDAPLQRYLWGVAAQAARMVFDRAYDRTSVRYTLTKGAHTTHLQFHEQNGQPYQLDAGDRTALAMRPAADWTLQRYRRSYSAITGCDPAADRQASPETLFAIPCDVAPDGIVYAKPTLHGTILQDRCTYVMADPRKMWRHITQHDPAMARHATRQFNRLDTTEWLNGFSALNPCDTGDYEAAPDRDTGKTVLHMTRGYAGLLRAACELDWPFVPLQLQIDTGYDRTLQQRFNATVNDLLQYRADGPLQSLVANTLRS